MEKTAAYNGKTVYVGYVAEDRTYALVTYNADMTRQFRVELIELTELNFSIETKIKEGDF